ncbi:MAG: hypothetical protein JRI23_13085, partial [Deltaproteobacteria bacterium]|nr:hypothetical protein [Deltaproteobacteria bacterium]MBW2532657.1 hypothetical protein [Deltaproteobacteria bacterium]
MLRLRGSLLVGACAGVITCGCGSPEAEIDPLPLPTPVAWPEPVPFVPAGSFVAAHPEAFERISGWATHVEGPVEERPDVGHRGALGVGNGWVFAMFGVGDPLNSMHSMVGPTYDRTDRFFGDYAVGLGPAGTSEPPAFDEEWAARSLSAPVVMTRGRLGSLVLDTVDFAPTTTDALERSCLLRVLTVRNTGATASEPQDVVVMPANANDVTALPSGALREEVEGRALQSGFVGFDGDNEGEVLRWSLDPLAAGAEAQAVLQHCALPSDTSTVMPSPDVHALLDATATAYRGWERELVQVELPDRMMADFIDGMKLTMKTQTTATGASCPMSNYTRTWARDNIGPTLAWLALGAHDDVRAMMDYLYGAVLVGGDLQNSYDADLDLSDLPPAPDWDAMPPLGGRVAAETPSYMVWMYGALYAHAGASSRAEQRWGFLRRCLFAQDFGPDLLLPFTGDETYRGAMNITFGLGIEYGHADKSYSANSSLLWLGAAHHFERLAAALGRFDDVERVRAQYVAVESALIDSYRLRDGCLSTHVSRETGERWPAPYEDVALKATWAGWLDPDDELAGQINTCHFNRLRSAPGQ